MLEFHGFDGEFEDLLSEEEEGEEDSCHSDQHPGQQNHHDHEHSSHLERDLNEPVRQERKHHVPCCQIFGEPVQYSPGGIGIEERDSSSQKTGEHSRMESFGLHESDGVDCEDSGIPSEQEQHQDKQVGETVERLGLLRVGLLNPHLKPLGEEKFEESGEEPHQEDERDCEVRTRVVAVGADIPALQSLPFFLLDLNQALG